MSEQPTPSPSEADYELRKLYPAYYTYLGALANTATSPNQEWRDMYKQRLVEIKAQIQEQLFAK